MARLRTDIVKKTKLTKPQEHALRVIRWFIRQNGHSPTQKELSEMLRMDTVQGCRSLVRALERKGYITRVPNAWRGIRLTDPDDSEPTSRP